jgi:hypothetical protein
MFQSGRVRGQGLSAFRLLPTCRSVDGRFLDLPVACFLIFSHPEDFLVGASHIVNPDVQGAVVVNERPTNIMTCFF